jgi:hypothetical protein
VCADGAHTELVRLALELCVLPRADRAIGAAREKAIVVRARVQRGRLAVVCAPCDRMRLAAEESTRRESGHVALRIAHKQPPRRGRHRCDRRSREADAREQLARARAPHAQLSLLIAAEDEAARCARAHQKVARLVLAKGSRLACTTRRHVQYRPLRAAQGEL